MKNLRKLVKKIPGMILCIAVLVIIGSSLAGATGNISDQNWGQDENGGNHYFQASNPFLTTAVRVKLDNTSTYCWFKTGTLGSIRITIYGSASNSTTNNPVNCTGPSIANPLAYYTMQYQNANKYFMNTVYERSLPYSFIKFTSYTTGTAQGVWSPDSV